MSKEDIVTSSPSTDPAKSKQSKNILLALFMVLVLLGIVLATFLYQNTKLKNAASQNPSQKTQAELRNSKGKVVAYPQSSLDITLSSAKYVKPYVAGGGYGTTAFLGVDLTVHNPTSASILLATELFKLKSSTTNNYPVFPPKFVHNSSLPAGYVRLLDQPIKANETIKGVVVFILPNTNLSSFIFSNGTQSFPVNVTK